jgi:hypothetical protein
VLRVGLALADALAHAHERGVVHRDVKPQNVMVPDRATSGRGAAKLTDFGVAHLVDDDAITRTGDVVGTLAYMAPEQAEGRRVDPRTDLYALGLVLYEALAGENPVRGASPAATARKVGTVLPSLARPRPDLPPGLTAAVDRAVRPKPGERGRVEDLSDALVDALDDVEDVGGAIARHPLEGPRRLPAPPRPVLRLAAGLAAGALVATALAWAGAALPEPVTPLLAGAGVALLVAVLPRLGWGLAAVALAVFLAVDGRPGAAVVVAAAALPVAALARRAGLGWSLPAAAPLLGLATLAGAYPALAGRARRLPARAGLGALGPGGSCSPSPSPARRWPSARASARRRAGRATSPRPASASSSRPSPAARCSSCFLGRWPPRSSRSSCAGAGPRPICSPRRSGRARSRSPRGSSPTSSAAGAARPGARRLPRVGARLRGRPGRRSGSRGRAGPHVRGAVP